MTTITTSRLTLRPPIPADAEALVRGLNNLAVSRWTGRIPHPYGAEDAAAFLDHCRSLPDGAHVLAITREDRLIGVIGIEAGELGYWLAQEEWGRGFGREAARAMTDHALGALGLDRLEASYHLGNEASRRILEGLGFVRTGEGNGFSRARQEEVPLVLLELTRASWAEAQERRR